MNSKGTAGQAAQPVGYQVDDLAIDIGRQRVTRGGAEIRLPGLSFDLLLALARAAPNLLTYDQLIEGIWAGVIVNQETVNQRVKLVRDALGDNPRAPRYIVGVRGRGYRVLPAVVPVATSNALAATAADAVAQPGAMPTHPSARSRRHAGLLAAGALAALLAAAFVLQLTPPNGSRQPPAAAPPEKTIAVLPFVNISGDADNEYFSDGLTEELLNRLANVPELRVAARTSSFHFKNHAESVKTIGQSLGVRHLLEGSVRKQGDRIRVTAQLVNTQDGYHLWSNTFERRVADIFAIQDEIARAVVEELRVELLPEGYRAVSTSSPEAHDLYLRARHLYQGFQLERMDKAIGYYEQAIGLDPNFAAAYVGLADALGWRQQIAERPHTPEISARIQTLARKALELEPTSGDAHALLGAELMYAYDFEGARRELQRAETLSPNGEYVIQSVMAYYMLVGWPPERAIEYARRGRDRDPLNPWAAIHVAQAHWHAQQYAEALRELERVVEIDPEFWLAHWWGAMTLLDLGRYEEALAAARRAVELHEATETLDLLALAHVRAGNMQDARTIVARLEASGAQLSAGLLVALGNREAALSSLEEAHRKRDRWLPSYLHEKLYLPLHAEPRFQELARSLGQERRVERTAKRAVAANR